jgi:acyl-CoA thioester hydrolase
VSDARIPERFEITFPVAPGDIDELGHVNNTVYVRWIQDVAVAHWRASAPPDAQASLAWVVARHEVDYKHPALLGDEIRARTWVGPASRLAFERNTEMYRARDGRLLVKARTIWVPISPATGRPVEVSAAVREQFSVPGGLERGT